MIYDQKWKTLILFGKCVQTRLRNYIRNCTTLNNCFLCNAYIYKCIETIFSQYLVYVVFKIILIVKRSITWNWFSFRPVGFNRLLCFCRYTMLIARQQNTNFETSFTILQTKRLCGEIYNILESNSGSCSISLFFKLKLSSHLSISKFWSVM